MVLCIQFWVKDISKVEVTERLEKKKFEFSQNFGMVNFENLTG